MKLSRSDAEDFLIQEAALLDSWKLMEWADLFTEDGEYWCPRRRSRRQGRQVAVPRL